MKTIHSFPNFHRAFTLIELLVVIAIIAVLAGLAFSTFQRVMIQADTTKSASNLRQLGNALMLYASENNGYYPPVASQVKDAEGQWSHLGSWDSYILNYLLPEQSINQSSPESFYPKILGTKAVFSPPRDKGVVVTANRIRRGYSMPSAPGMIGVATFSGNEFRPSEQQYRLPQPTKTLLLVERPGYEDNFVGRTGFAGINTPADQKLRQPDLNSGGKFNYLFADGRVQLLTPEQTVGTGSLNAPKGFWTIAVDD